jgi:hypothetical protein
MENVLQVIIFVFSASAIWFVGRKESWRRWGFVIGLCGQPFWLWVTFRAGQWGMFLLSLWYAYAWAQGVRNWWKE